MNVKTDAFSMNSSDSAGSFSLFQSVDRLAGEGRHEQILRLFQDQEKCEAEIRQDRSIFRRSLEAAIHALATDMGALVGEYHKAQAADGRMSAKNPGRFQKNHSTGDGVRALAPVMRAHEVMRTVVSHVSRRGSLEEVRSLLSGDLITKFLKLPANEASRQAFAFISQTGFLLRVS